jgi:hypothetical protein
MSKIEEILEGSIIEELLLEELNKLPENKVILLRMYTNIDYIILILNPIVIKKCLKYFTKKLIKIEIKKDGLDLFYNNISINKIKKKFDKCLGK